LIDYGGAEDGLSGLARSCRPPAWCQHCQRMATSSLPLLLLDVDGVLNPFAAPACPPGYTGHELFPGEDLARLCPAHGL
jgi:hypothetical protein